MAEHATDTTVEAEALRRAIEQGTIDSHDPASVKEATDGE